jgi:hypothetical protein
MAKNYYGWGTVRNRLPDGEIVPEFAFCICCRHLVPGQLIRVKEGSDKCSKCEKSVMPVFNEMGGCERVIRG